MEENIKFIRGRNVGYGGNISPHYYREMTTVIPPIEKTHRTQSIMTVWRFHNEVRTKIQTLKNNMAAGHNVW